MNLRELKIKTKENGVRIVSVKNAGKLSSVLLSNGMTIKISKGK
jgi:hypothetical protein